MGKVKSDCKECENKRWIPIYKDESRDLILSEKEYRKLREYSEKEMIALWESIPEEEKRSAKPMEAGAPILGYLLDMFVQHEKVPNPKVARVLAAIKADDEKTKGYISQIINCPECHIPDLLFRKSQTSHSRIVDLELVNELHKDKKIIDLIVKMIKEPMASFMVISQSHLGKSVLLKYNFNRVLKKKEGKTNDMLYITEYELKPIMEDDSLTNDFLRKLDSIRYLFMDEFFSLDLWIDQKLTNDKHYASIRRSNTFRLWDYLEQRADTIVCQIAANNVPSKIFKALDITEAEKKINRINNVAGRVSFLTKKEEAEASQTEMFDKKELTNTPT
jgi:hypothetical protein